jgi:hypothetical protein
VHLHTSLGVLSSLPQIFAFFARVTAEFALRPRANSVRYQIRQVDQLLQVFSIKLPERILHALNQQHANVDAAFRANLFEGFTPQSLFQLNQNPA